MEFLVCRELRFTVQGHRGMMGARPCRLQLISPRVLSKECRYPLHTLKRLLKWLEDSIGHSRTRMEAEQGAGWHVFREAVVWV